MGIESGLGEELHSAAGKAAGNRLVVASFDVLVIRDLRCEVVVTIVARPMDQSCPVVHLPPMPCGSAMGIDSLNRAANAIAVGATV